MFLEKDEIKAIQQFQEKNFSPALRQVHFCKRENLIWVSNSFIVFWVKGKLDKENWYEHTGNIQVDISEFKRMSRLYKYLLLSKYDQSYMQYWDHKGRVCLLKYDSETDQTEKKIETKIRKLFDEVRLSKQEKIWSIPLIDEFERFTKVMTILGHPIWRKVVKIGLWNVAYYEDDRHILVYRLWGNQDE